MITDRERVEVALDRMVEKTEVQWRGGDWICCHSCGHAEMEDDKVSEYVFWHEQTEESAFGIEKTPQSDLKENWVEQTNWLQGTLYLYHSGKDAAKAAKRVLEEDGFRVVWNGDPSKAVQIRRNPEWRDEEQYSGGR